MELNLAERKRIEQWLKDRHVRQCPTCGLQDFYVGAVTAPPTMVQVICGNCAHVLLFDANAIGLRISP